jgi:hypothetical protein
MVRMAFRTSHVALPSNGWEILVSLSNQLTTAAALEWKWDQLQFPVKFPSPPPHSCSDLVLERRSRAGAGQREKCPPISSAMLRRYNECPIEEREGIRGDTRETTVA